MGSAKEAGTSRESSKTSEAAVTDPGFAGSRIDRIGGARMLHATCNHLSTPTTAGASLPQRGPPPTGAAGWRTVHPTVVPPCAGGPIPLGAYVRRGEPLGGRARSVRAGLG